MKRRRERQPQGRQDSGLSDAIVAAWQNEVRPDPDGSLHEPTCRRPECADLLNYFANRSWQDVSWKELRKACGAHDVLLTLMSPVGFRYYLPAFLRMRIEEPRSRECKVIYHLYPHEGWQEKADSLTLEQQRVVLRFLEGQRDELAARKTQVPAALAEPWLDAGIRFWQRRVDCATSGE
jgi:hypothetical protein